MSTSQEIPVLHVNSVSFHEIKCPEKINMGDVEVNITFPGVNENGRVVGCYRVFWDKEGRTTLKTSFNVNPFNKILCVAKINAFDRTKSSGRAYYVKPLGGLDNSSYGDIHVHLEWIAEKNLFVVVLTNNGK